MRAATWLLLKLSALLTISCALGHSPDLPSGVGGDGDGSFGGDGDGDDAEGIDDSGDNTGSPASGGEPGSGGEGGRCGDGGLGGSDPAQDQNETESPEPGPCAP